MSAPRVDYKSVEDLDVYSWLAGSYHISATKTTHTEYITYKSSQECPGGCMCCGQARYGLYKFNYCSLAEVIISRLVQSYISRGGGFNGAVAGASITGARNLSAMVLSTLRLRALRRPYSQTLYKRLLRRHGHALRRQSANIICSTRSFPTASRFSTVWDQIDARVMGDWRERGDSNTSNDSNRNDSNKGDDNSSE